MKHNLIVGVKVALRPVLCDDIGGKIQGLCREAELQERYEICKKFRPVLDEIPDAARKFFAKLLYVYIANIANPSDAVSTEYLGLWELAFPDHDVEMPFLTYRLRQYHRGAAPYLRRPRPLL